ncbi:MAG: hypothetical protein WC881_00785 [Elusimicrobiota bacterium]
MKNKRARKVRKNLAMFLTSEEGKILKGNVVKTATFLGLLGAAMLPGDDALAQHSNYLHNSGGTGAHYSHGSHASHASHASHGSHSSHSSGGWC